jgi:hypothetical protein
MSECVLRPQPELTALAGTSTPLTRPEGITGMNTTESNTQGYQRR